MLLDAIRRWEHVCFDDGLCVSCSSIELSRDLIGARTLFGPIKRTPRGVAVHAVLLHQV